MKSAVLVLLGLLATQGPPVGKVESTFDKKVNFTTLKTYSWISGYDAYNPEAHKMVVAAIEAEMTGLGFTKQASGGDVTLAYYTVTGADVDLKTLDKVEKEGGIAPTKARARLVVIMRGAASSQKNQQIWTASTREYVDPDPVALSGAIKSVTARLFETYPTRKR